MISHMRAPLYRQTLMGCWKFRGNGITHTWLVGQWVYFQVTFTISFAEKLKFQPAGASAQICLCMIPLLYWGHWALDIILLLNNTAGSAAECFAL